MDFAEESAQSKDVFKAHKALEEKKENEQNEG